MSEKSTDLMVVMPVYNEEASVRKVIMEWFPVINDCTENFVFLAIDDGSKDGTLAVLEDLKKQFGDRVEIISRKNRGHGQSCLEGYRVAISRGIPWDFQIDSDGQCDPQYFFRVWSMRPDFDVIYGSRYRRDDGWRRVVASQVLRLTLLFSCAVNCVDANVPYRLIRTDILRGLVDRIPDSFNLANIALSVLLRRLPKVRQGVVKIRFLQRYGGEPSVTLGKFGSKATELVAQLKRL